MPEVKRDLNSIVKQITGKKRDELEEGTVQNLLQEFGESLLEMDENLKRHIPGMPGWFVKTGFQDAWRKIEAKQDVKHKLLKDIADKFDQKENIAQATAILEVLLQSDLSCGMYFAYQIERILKKTAKSEDIEKAPVARQGRESVIQILMAQDGKLLKEISNWVAKNDEEKRWLKTVAPLLFDVFFCFPPTRLLKENPEALYNFLEWIFTGDQLGECMARCEQRISSLIAAWPEEYRKQAQEIDARLIKAETANSKTVKSDAKEGKPTSIARSPQPANEQHSRQIREAQSVPISRSHESGKLADLENRILKLEQEAQHANGLVTNTDLEKKMGVLAENMAILAKALNTQLARDDLRSRYEALVREKEELSKNCYTLDEELGASQKKVKDLEEKKVNFDKRQEELLREIQTLESEKRDLEEKIKGYAENIETMQSQHKQELSIHTTRMENIAAQKLQSLREKIADSLKTEYENGLNLPEDAGAGKIIINNIFSDLKGLGINLG